MRDQAVLHEEERRHLEEQMKSYVFEATAAKQSLEAERLRNTQTESQAPTPETFTFNPPTGRRHLAARSLGPKSDAPSGSGAWLRSCDVLLAFD